MGLRGLLLLPICAAVMGGVWLLHGLDRWTRPAPPEVRWTSEAGPGRSLGRFATPPEAHASAFAIYFSSVGGKLRVRLNGAPLFDSTAARFQPLLLHIAQPLRSAGEHNELSIELQPDRIGGAFLGQVRIGPQAVLAPQYAQRRFIKHTLPSYIAVIAIALGLISAVLWLGRRKDRVYLWHAAACFVIGSYIALTIAPQLLPLPWAEAIGGTLAAMFAQTCALLGLELYGVPWSGANRRRVMLAMSAASLLPLPAAAVLEPAIFLGWIVPGLWAAYLPIVVLIIWRIYGRGFRANHDAGTFWMMAAASGIGVVALRDALVMLGLMPREQGLWSAYVIAMPMAAFTWVLLQRFLHALDESEALNRELEDRVAMREAQIAQAWRERQRLERERVLSAERERLFQDMHDGLGGTLTATLARLSNEGADQTPVAYAVKSALDDLRSILASLDPDERSLRVALANLRERLSDDCAASGMQLEFELHALPDDLELQPARLLHLLRIVREACSNALRHAQATRLRIVAALLDGAIEADSALLEILIEDNGIGFDPDQSQRPGHHGLANLKRRASRLRGSIEWIAANPGTRVRIRLPLHPQA